MIETTDTMKVPCGGAVWPDEPEETFVETLETFGELADLTEAMKFWAQNVVKGKKGFQPTGSGRERGGSEFGYQAGDEKTTGAHGEVLGGMADRVDAYVKTWQTKPISDEAVQGLRDYSYQGGAVSINNALRKEAATGRAINPKTQAKVDAIDSAFVNRLKEPTVVFRGTTIEAFGISSLDNLKGLVGQRVRDAGYLSTSFDKSGASFFGQSSRGKHAEPHVDIEIHVPAGTPAVYKTALGVSVHVDEMELLLPRGSTLRVRSTSLDYPFGRGVGEQFRTGKVVADLVPESGS